MYKIYICIYIYIFASAYVYSRHQSQSPIHLCFHRQVFWIRRICWKRSPSCRWVNSKCPWFCMEFPWIFFHNQRQKPSLLKKVAEKSSAESNQGVGFCRNLWSSEVSLRKNLSCPQFHIRTCINPDPDSLPKTIFVHWGTRCFSKTWWAHLGVSKNRGTPKSSILIGFSIINHPFWGTRILGNTHLCLDNDILCLPPSGANTPPTRLVPAGGDSHGWKQKPWSFSTDWAFESQDMEKKSHARYWILYFIDCSWLFWFRSKLK